MNLRDLKPEVLKQLAQECRTEFEKWLRSTDGKMFSKDDKGIVKRIPIPHQTLWDTGFSAGARAILRRVDALKDL